MKKQNTFSSLEFKGKKKETKKEIFLNAMESLIPWNEWLSVVEKVYPKAGNGRRPIEMEVMLRMYLVQIWFNLSDETTEDSIYDIQSIRNFVGIDLIEENAPDATTLLKFRHLLEDNNLTKEFFEAIKYALTYNGYMLKQGTIVDATIIKAPSSRKNKDKKRDPEMSSTKKGNNYYFGMKSHIGVDKDSGFIHTIETTPANIHDISVADKLLHGEEKELYADAGYIGVEKRKAFTDKSIKYNINMRRKSYFQSKDLKNKEKQRKISSVRSKVEYPFHIIKNLFKFKKTNYKGLHKNTVKIYMLFTLANLYLCKQKGINLKLI